MALFGRSPKAKSVPDQRKALKKARKRDRKAKKVLQIVPPEGVPFELTLASLGGRLGAQITDFLVTYLSALVILIALAYAFNALNNAFFILVSLLFFLIRLPYYILTEFIWNGRTLAKRWMGLRVVSVNGQGLTPYQIVVRNLMREVEFFAPLTYLLVGSTIHWSLYVIAMVWVVILLIVPWRNSHNQRIGDILAGTAVIEDPKPILLSDMAQVMVAKTPETEDRFPFTTEHLDQYGSYELQVLERVLRTSKSSKSTDGDRQKKYLAEIVDRITTKIKYPEKIDQRDHKAFLSSFYRAQRAYLENRKLFGDARDDKFFKLDQKEKDDVT